MKFMTVLGLIFALAVCFSACGENADKKESPKTDINETTDATSENSEEKAEGEKVENPSEDEKISNNENSEQENNATYVQQTEENADDEMSDAEKVADFVADNGGFFKRMFDKMYGDVATASVSAEGTTVVIAMTVKDYSSEDYKKQNKVKAEDAVDSVMSSSNVVGAIRGIEPAVSAVSISICGNDGITVFSKIYK